MSGFAVTFSAFGVGGLERWDLKGERAVEPRESCCMEGEARAEIISSLKRLRDLALRRKSRPNVLAQAESAKTMDFALFLKNFEAAESWNQEKS
jgi:hypothetical protein